MMTGWRFLFRVLLKAAILFILANLIFALLDPVEVLGHVSLYNGILPGRDRLPYGENPSESYNLNLYSVPAMFASDVIARPKASDEYRVLLIGDSSTWGWFLANKDTYAANLNAANLKSSDGRRIVAYNLGYPIESVTKDLMLLDEAMNYQPDQIVWLVSLQSLPRDQQVYPPIVQNNAPRVRDLISHYGLQLDPNDSRFVTPDFLGKTIVGQRRALADWLRLQLYGFSWAATGIDQTIPASYTPRKSDFDTDISWDTFKQETTLTDSDLAFDVLAAGISRAGSIPIIIINEPMFISTGTNSDLRYNAFYPRWAYDQYRDLLQKYATDHGWNYLDWWDRINPAEFTDSPVHLTAAGSRQLSSWLATAITAASEVSSG
jgi:lysophospholipase L1-like esterase